MQPPSGPAGRRPQQPPVDRTDAIVNALFSDQTLRAAMRGKPTEFKTALEARRAKARSEQEREVIDEIIANPQLLTLRAISNTPDTGEAGAAQLRRVQLLSSSLNLFEATRMLVFEKIPIWPTGRYVVRPRASGKGYSFFGRLPATQKMQALRAGMAVGLLAVIAVVAFVLIDAQSHADLVVVNGFSTTVFVAVGDAESVPVTPNGHSELRVPAGKLRLVATDANGNVLEDIEANVPGASKSIYNVLGCGAVYMRTWHYSSDSSERAPPSTGSEWHCRPDPSHFTPSGVSVWFGHRPEYSKSKVVKTLNLAGWDTIIKEARTSDTTTCAEVALCELAVSGPWPSGNGVEASVLDINRDGRVVRDEFKSDLQAMFDRADLNGDGELTPDETVR